MAAEPEQQTIGKDRHIPIGVAGVTFDGRQDALAYFASYGDDSVIKVTLEREPENEYDSNAIAVKATVDAPSVPTKNIGYIPANLARKMAMDIDNGVPVKALELEITGRNQDTLGAKVTVNWPTSKRHEGRAS